MKTKELLRVCVAISCLVLTSFRAQSQGTFQNLDFESSVLPLVHLGGSFDFVAASNAVPGWSVYLGTNQVNYVLHNDYFGGTATVGLLGPGWSNASPAVIEGDYTVILQAGLYPSVEAFPVDAAITQSSLFPVSARSLIFKAKAFQSVVFSRFAVLIDGQTINMVPLANTANYTLYGGDITAFAGLNAELRIAAIGTPNYKFSAFAFDSIQLSSEPIPEPRVAAFIGLGTLCIACRFFLRARY